MRVKGATDSYPARTGANARHSDATVWFGRIVSPGVAATEIAYRRHGKSMLIVEPGDGVRPSEVAARIAVGGYRVFDVAGNRQSYAPGLGERVERFLCEVFRQLGFTEAADRA